MSKGDVASSEGGPQRSAVDMPPPTRVVDNHVAPFVDAGPGTRYHLGMTLIERVRNEAMSLPAGERASLAQELILSLGDPAAADLDPAQEAEIRRRLNLVRQGTASGRSAADVFAEIRAAYS
jgi:putative addiction module component (TIGR02574 family)